MQMHDRIMELLGSSVNGKSESIAQDEARFAAAALLVHIARVDGEHTADENDRLKKLLVERFALRSDELAELIGSADDAEREAVDLYRFTSVITRSLDQYQRQDIVGMLWSLALADGEIHEFEDDTIWRVAELLDVPTRDCVRLKNLVLGANDS